MKQLGKEISHLIKHSGIYGVGVVLSKAVGFFMIPIYTRYLRPEDYGVLELLDLIVFFVGIFAASGINGAIFRFYAVYERESDKKEVVATGFIYYTAASFFFAVVLTLWGDSVSGWVFGNPAYGHLVRVVGWTLFFANLCEVPICYWRATERSALVVWVGLARTVLGAGTLAIALAWLKMGLVGAVYASLITNAISGVVIAGVMLASVPLRTSRAKLGEMLKFGAPLIMWSIASFILTFSDRFFLRKFGTLADVGVYSLAYKIGQIVTLLVNGPFGMVWAWKQFDLAKLAEGRAMYAKICTYLMFLSLIVGLGLSIFTKEVLHWFVPQSYWAARFLVPFIVLSYILHSMRSVSLSGVLIQKTTHQLAVLSVIASVLNLGANYLLIPHYLAMGAAVATLITNAATMLMALYIGQRNFRIKYEYGRLLAAGGIATAIYLVSILNPDSTVIGTAFDALLLITFALIAYAILSKEERQMLWDIVTQGRDAFRRFGGKPAVIAGTEPPATETGGNLR